MHYHLKNDEDLIVIFFAAVLLGCDIYLQVPGHAGGWG